jgi:hypothetical protein
VGGFVVPPARGATSVTFIGFPWPYVTSPTLANGDYLRLQSASPVRYEEMLTAGGTLTAPSLTPLTVSGVKFDYTAEPWAMVCHRGFLPVLRLPLNQRDQQIFTHDRRITWSIDFWAEEAPFALSQFAGAPDLPVSDGTNNRYRGLEPKPQVQPPGGAPNWWT